MLYIYQARERSGKLISGEVEAATVSMAVSNLRSAGYTVISIDQRAQQSQINLGEFWQKINKSYRQELIFFSRQLASLLRSGVPLTTALFSISDTAKSKILKDTLRMVLADIQSGVSFSESLNRHPRIFSELFVSMIKVGEATGILEEVLERLSDLSSQEQEIKSRLKSALTYPVILCLVAVGVVSFLLINIIPKFTVVFEAYDAKLPWTTQALLFSSSVIQRFWWGVLITLILIISGFLSYFKTKDGRYKFDAWLLKMPFFGSLYLKVIVSRFARVLGALVKSGVPILEALYVTKKTIRNSVINGVMDNLISGVSAGKSLTEPLKVSNIFPGTVIQMISLGEQTGKLDAMLFEVASFYEREVDYTIKDVTAALEPLLLLTMGAVVAFIALSVLMPIFNLIKVFRK